MSEKRYRPFGNGTSYMFWKEYNCARCTKWSDDASLCPLQEEIDWGAWTDGTVTEEAARGIGMIDKDGNRLDKMCPWRCPAFEAVKK